MENLYKETGTKDFSHQKRKVNLPVYFYQFRIVLPKEYQFRNCSQWSHNVVLQFFRKMIQK